MLYDQRRCARHRTRGQVWPAGWASALSVTDHVNQTPHSAARIGTWWGTVPLVLFVELYRPAPRFVIVFAESAQSRLVKSFGALEELCGATLRFLTLYIDRTVFEMENEP
jgi:hypothetical protein